MDAQGVFTEMAADPAGKPQPDLTVQLYNPSYDKDRFENTALTIDGSAAGLKFLYAGAYLVRHIEQVQDYTAYAHSGFYVDYYQCVNPGPPAQAKCFTPSSIWRNVERNTHLSQELRVSTPKALDCAQSADCSTRITGSTIRATGFISRHIRTSIPWAADRLL